MYKRQDQYTEDILIKAESDNSVHTLKDINLGLYYLGINFANTVRLMWETPYPNHIPAIDLVSPIQRHHTDEEWKLLMDTHKKFVEAADNREQILAHGSGHYIYKDNPGLVLNAIVTAYVFMLSDQSHKMKVLDRALQVSSEELIKLKTASKSKDN